MANGYNYDIHKVSCDKNNHEGYKTPCPIHLFQIPERFKTTDFQQLIKFLCSLTVKLIVKSRSKKRTEQNPLENVSDRFYQEFQGSGRIVEIKDCSHDTVYQNSQMDCKAILIYIKTCHHLVFDESEAHNTECILFFDDVDAQHTKTLSNGRLIESDNVNDISILAFSLSDNSVVDLLESHLYNFTLLSKKLQKKYKYVKEEDRLSVIVSHPHGCYKCVAFGTWDLEDGYFTYTATTCRASSGGSVFLLGVNSNDLIHRGVSPSGKNCSNSVDRPISCVLMEQRRADM